MTRRVLLVGWDAADWKIIHPLMERNLMPATRRLVEEGVMGHMATLSPVLSPMLWTSIATGKRPYKHGILGFIEPAPGGGVQPVTNLSRTTKAVWNIFSQQGLRCNVIGWWPSHPAEPINGVMVSNHYQHATAPMDRGWSMRRGTVHPARLADTLAALRVHPQELGAEHVLPFIPHAAAIDQAKDRRLETCVRIIADCSSIQSCATHVMVHEPWDFMAVYFDAIDHFSHAFMRYHPPQQDWITDEDFDRYKHVVTAGYVYHDMMLARLLELAGPDTTVVLMSDHGFHPDHLRRRALPSEPAGPAAEHRDFGIFVLHGPGIKRDELIHGVSLLDVTPTLLTLFGLPVGEDMDGRPLVEAFENRPEVARIPSWDDVAGADGRHPPGSHLTHDDAREGIEHLVALGYVERPSDDAGEAVRDCERELNYNLARAHVDGGQHGLAVPILVDLYRDKPLEFRFGIELAICLKALGVVNDLDRLIENLNARWRQASAEARRRLSEIAAVAKERRAARNQSADPVTAPPPLFSRAEQNVVRKLRAIARGNPGTLDYLAGWVATARKDHEGALVHFARAERTQSTAPGFHLQLGDAYHRLGRYAEADACFNRARDLDPATPGAYLGLARTALRRGRPKQAAEYAARALGLRYQMPPAHYCLGLARLALRDVDGAIDAFETALSQNPNFPEVHRRLAGVYSRVFNDQSRAVSHRAMAMQIRSERRRQASRRLIPELPLLDPAGTRDHLPAFPSSQTAPGRRPCLGDPPGHPGRGATGSATDTGNAVVVVSGLPRSGTSMMMQMLVAGGVAPMTDVERPADEGNPRGYFELARVKQLQMQNDWLDEARGRALKVVSPLVPYLPQGVEYRVIVMERDLEEIVRSQRRLLEHLGHDRARQGPDQLALFLRQQVALALSLLKAHNVPTIVVSHAETVADPGAAASRVAGFLGLPLDIAAMAAVVDSMLYRERNAASGVR
jgi:tetratricopeptide (TPR) repeat protein/arylsulfatase A-like enzyme